MFFTLNKNMNFYFFNALKYRYYRAYKRFKFSNTRAEKVKKPKKIAIQMAI